MRSEKTCGGRLEREFENNARLYEEMIVEKSRKLESLKISERIE